MRVPRREVWQPWRHIANWLSERLRQRRAHCPKCGLFAMVSDKTSRWRCPQCNGLFTWYGKLNGWQ